MKQVFLVKVKKEEATEEYMVPRYPELVMTKLLSENVWEAKNNQDDSVSIIKKITKGKFCEYEITLKDILHAADN